MSMADPLTTAQCSTFIEMAIQRNELLYAALFSFQLFSLARIEEARRIKRRDLLDDNQIVRYRLTREVVKKRQRALAVFDIPEPARFILGHWLEKTRWDFGKANPDALVFTHKFKKAAVNPRTVNFAYQRIAKACHFREHVSSHTPRVSGSIMVYQAFKANTGDALVALSMVQDLLKHGDINTTARYLRLKTADRPLAASTLGLAIGNGVMVSLPKIRKPST
jgi:integrase